MSGFVQWNEVPSGGERTNFLALKSGNTYKIRPLLQPLNFHKYFHKVDGKMRTAVVSEEVVAQMAAKYPDLGKPANRYAMYVLDRNDNNQIKVMEFPISVYKQFSNSFQATNNEPGSKVNGSDWMIKISGTGFNTTYETTFIANTPLTEEEINVVKTELAGDSEKLATIFPFNEVPQAEKRLFNPDEKGNGGQASSPAVSAPAVSSPAVSGIVPSTGSDEDFNPDW